MAIAELARRAETLERDTTRGRGVGSGDEGLDKSNTSWPVHPNIPPGFKIRRSVYPLHNVIRP
ncbi:MAG TPA: hypothetical protein VIF57_09640 [Polyangia bacterium]